MSNYDKEQWQAEEEAREVARSAYRDKMSKARERSASNAKRKIARLHTKLTELGHISEFEDEFGESVLERLEKYGSAFHDPEKGRAGDALSMAQRQVVNRMNRKLKDLKAKTNSMPRNDESDGFQEELSRTYKPSATSWKKKGKTHSSFKAKNAKYFKSNTRYIDEEECCLPDGEELERQERVEVDVRDGKTLPFIPHYNSDLQDQNSEGVRSKEKAKRPFLRLVTSDT